MKKWKNGALVGGAALVVVAFVAHMLPGCGGGSSGPVCGNGELESGEACDDGNLSNDDNCSATCTVLSTTAVTIAWPINKGAFVTNPNDTDACPDVGATHAVINLKGGTPPAGMQPVDRTKEFGCDLGQNKFLNVPLEPIYPGPYQAKVKLIRRVAANDAGIPAGDEVLTREITLDFTVADRTPSMQTANFTIPDFLKSYTGGLQFNTRWNGATTCAGATPPVTRQFLLLKKMDGTVISKMTLDSSLTPENESMKTDGTASGPCVNAGISQQILGLDWGNYSIGIKGLAAGDVPAFCYVFPVFVGAQQGPGTTNPTHQLVVPALGVTMPDGGVDGGADDAGPPDAGMSVCF